MYLSNKQLYIEIIVSKAQGKTSPELQKYLVLIANKMIKKFYFTNPDDKNDVLQTGIFRALANWYKFDEQRFDNAFAYISEIIKRGFAEGYNKIKHNEKWNVISYHSTGDNDHSSWNI